MDNAEPKRPGAGRRGTGARSSSTAHPPRAGRLTVSVAVGVWLTVASSAAWAADSPTEQFTPSPTPTPVPTEECTELGYLHIAAPSVDPPQLRVGDTVTLRFPVDYALPGGIDCGFSESCQLEGGEPYLSGTAPEKYESASGEIIVRRQAALAGMGQVRLEVVYETEERCCFSESNCFFSYIHRSASSPFVDFSVAANSAGHGGNGCQIGAARDAYANCWGWAGLVWLLSLRGGRAPRGAGSPRPPID